MAVEHLEHFTRQTFHTCSKMTISRIRISRVYSVGKVNTKAWSFLPSFLPWSFNELLQRSTNTWSV